MGLIFKKSTAQPIFTQQAIAAGNASVGVTLNGLYTLQKRARTVTTEWWRYTSIALENPIRVATTSDYQIQPADADHYLEFIVTASNAAGTVVSRSGITAQVVGSGNPEPEFEAGAVITGQPKVGSTLEVGWTAVYADTETVQWQASADNVTFANISGATATTYLLTASEQGDHIRAVVTIDNPSYDPVTSTSAATGQVAAADAELPPPAGAPAGAIPLNSANIASRVQHDGAVLLAGEGAYYYLVGDLSFTGAAFLINHNNITLDFNGCTVTWNTGNANTRWGSDGSLNNFLTSCSINKNGITTGWYADTYYPGVTFRVRVWGTVIKNGTLTTTATGRQGTLGIYAYDEGSFSITAMKIVGATGDNNFCVGSNYMPFNVTDSVIIDNSTTTWNRQLNPAGIVARNSSIYARRVVVIGGNGGMSAKSNCDIRNCFISNNGFATNGYCFSAFGGSNNYIANNLMLPHRGRGIIFDSGSTNSTAENNVILTWEAPNAEFGDRLNAGAFRSRYVVKSLAYAGNFSLGVGGKNASKDQDLTGGTGIYLTNNSSSGPYNNYSNNDCHSILIGTDLNVDIVSVPLTLEGQGAVTGFTPGEDSISGNRFYSNVGMVRMSGGDGYCRHNAPITGNTWGWKTGPESYAAFEAQAAAKLAALGLTGERYTEALARYTSVMADLADHIDDAAAAGLKSARTFWRVLAWSPNSQWEYADIVDSTFESGVDPLTYTGNHPYAAGLVVRDGFTHTLQLLNNGTPLSGVRVTVTPVGLTLPSGAPRSNTTTVDTDSGGSATMTFWRRAVTKGLNANDPINTTTVTQSTISITDLSGNPIAGTEEKTVTHASLGATLNMAST